MPEMPQTAADIEAIQARRKAAGVSAVQVLRKYLKGLERHHEILPGAGEVILPKVLDRAGSEPDRSLANLAAFLQGEGKVYLDPSHRPDADAEREPALMTALRRFGVPKDEADKLYRANALEFATHAGPPAVQARQVLVRLGQADRLGAGEEGLSMLPRTVELPAPRATAEGIGGGRF